MGRSLYLSLPARAIVAGKARENPYIDTMSETKDVDRATAPAGQAQSPPQSGAGGEPGQSARTPFMVPIRSLGANHRDRIAVHLMCLDSHDRYLRFGYAASDQQIRHYIDGLDFERDEIFGIYNRKLEMIAMAHLAYPTEKTFDSCAEFGVSVLKSARGRGYGARLFERAAIHARNDGITQMFIHALSENTAMLKIAKRAGAIVQRDGAEAEAYLRLPAATLDSRMTEIVQEQMAQADYRMKAQAKQFSAILAGLRAARCGAAASKP